MASSGAGMELVDEALQGYSGPRIAFESMRGVAAGCTRGQDGRRVNGGEESGGGQGSPEMLAGGIQARAGIEVEQGRPG